MVSKIDGLIYETMAKKKLNHLDESKSIDGFTFKYRQTIFLFQKFLVVFTIAMVAAASADVAHLKKYLPPTAAPMQAAPAPQLPVQTKPLPAVHQQAIPAPSK